MLAPDSKSMHSYHHGNVKEELIIHALHWIETEGVASLSMRNLARRVGITAPAIYNHFSDKNELIHAVKMRALEQFNSYFDARCSSVQGSEEKLVEMCFAYYHYSRELPSRFSFIFGSALPLAAGDEEDQAIASHCIFQARELLSDIFRNSRIPCNDEKLANQTLLMWSQIHGIVILKSSGTLRTAASYLNWGASFTLEDDEEVEQLIRQQIRTLTRSIMAESVILDPSPGERECSL